MICHFPIDIGKFLQLVLFSKFSLTIEKCVLSKWGEWSGCQQSCVDTPDTSMTERIRNRHIIEDAAHGGIECPKYLQEVKECTLCDTKDSHEDEFCIHRCPGRNSNLILIEYMLAF